VLLGPHGEPTGLLLHSAADEDGIFAQVAGHAAADHGVTDISPELVQAVRDRITHA
jgi:predicted small metal-binding protein